MYCLKPGISVTKKPAIFFQITLRGNVEKGERIEKKGGTGDQYAIFGYLLYCSAGMMALEDEEDTIVV